MLTTPPSNGISLGEFDYGQNAFQLSNLYSGSGPLDAFGTATGTGQTTGKFAGNTCRPTAPCYTYHQHLRTADGRLPGDT